jgi:hypothetical protein
LRRLVNAPLSSFESIFEQEPEWSEVAYPPGSTPGSGSLRMVRAPAGGVVVHLTPALFDADSFRLRALFATGSGVFATPEDMFRFWNSELAKAFGAEVSVSLPEPVSEDVSKEPEPAVEAVCEPARRAHEKCAAVVSAPDLERQLAEVVHGQPAALERVAHVVATQFAKSAPSRPGTVLLLGPTGSGKTSTVEALPTALAALGRLDTHVFRVDCNELSERIQLTRLFGAPPGYVGHEAENPLLQALAKPDCILLLDEVEKAHPSVIQDVLLNLLDSGRLTAPDGSTVDAAHAVIAMTTNLAVDELELRLHDVPLEHRWAVQDVCREILLDADLPAELVGRIGAFAVFEALDDESLKAAAAGSVRSLAQEYGLTPVAVDPLLADVLLDIAGRSRLGARALSHAAGELLGGAFAAAVRDGARGEVVIETGPPIAVRVA